jgi:hypothetical protein
MTSWCRQCIDFLADLLTVFERLQTKTGALFATQESVLTDAFHEGRVESRPRVDIQGNRKSGIMGRAFRGKCQLLMSAVAAAFLARATAFAQPARRFVDGTSIASEIAEIESQGNSRSFKSLALHDPVVAIINERGFACSGVLIHRRAVLTARHCRGGRFVMFGANIHEQRRTLRVVGFREAPVRAIDMAIMILEGDAPVEPYSLGRAIGPPRDVRVVGFGCETPGSCDGAGQRTYFDARVSSAYWGCEPSRAAALNCLPSSEMVLPRSIGVDTCTGDSGGAVLERMANGWHLIAITSRGVRDAVLLCGDGGVYVRVQPQLGWIEKELEKLSE